jgi:hypothetical protein
MDRQYKSAEEPTMSQNELDESSLQTGTASCFLPGTNVQVAWDSTSLGYFKVCPRLYQYTMLDGYAPRGESIHLRFGLEYHAALEQYDRLIASGTPTEDAVRTVVADLYQRTAEWNPDPTTKAGRYKNRETLTSLVVDYLDHFADDPAETYIKSDGTPAVELSFRFELEWGPESGQTHGSSELDEDAAKLIAMGVDPGPTMGQPYLLCGHLDRVVSFNDQLLVMDRKTTTMTLGGYYFAQYEPHNQMSLYTLAGKVIMNAPIRGVIIDAAQILLEKPNAFARGFTYRTPDQLEEWLEDLRVTLSFAEACAQTNHFPMNDTSCDKFGGCRFRGICSKSPSVRERFLAADFDKLEEGAKWNPMRSR